MNTFAIVVLLLFAIAADGQTLNVAETSGKGKVSVFASPNALLLKDFTTAAYNWAVVGYGLTDRADIFVGPTSTTLLGQTQVGVTTGANVTLLKTRFVNVSDFALLSTPLTKRQEGCGLSLFNAVLASKSFGKVTPYVAYSVTVPLGDTQNKLFTSPAAVHNVPIGVMIPKGKVSYFAEYGFGGSMKTVGLGVAYVF